MPRDSDSSLIFSRHGIFPYFQPDFRQILRVILKSRVLNISIYDTNVPILVKMKGKSSSDNVGISKYGISHYLTLFLMLMPTPSNFKEVARVQFLIFFENFNAVVDGID